MGQSVKSRRVKKWYHWKTKKFAANNIKVYGNGRRRLETTRNIWGSSGSIQ